MLKKDKKGFYTLTSFAKFPITAVVSTKQLGDMRRKNGENLDKFSQTIGVKNFVRAGQVHGNKIVVVKSENAGETIEGCDGLVTGDFDLGLSVVTADCLPIMSYDPEKRMIGIAHVGWKGTLAGIAGELVSTFVSLGSKTENLSAGLGPCIEFCHYEIGQDVAEKFRKAGFGKSVLTTISGRLYLDLKQINIQQLEKAGVRKTNIDATVKTCTFESEDFYSFRRERQDLSGEFISLIVQKK